MHRYDPLNPGLNLLESYLRLDRYADKSPSRSYGMSSLSRTGRSYSSDRFVTIPAERSMHLIWSSNGIERLADGIPLIRVIITPDWACMFGLRL